MEEVSVPDAARELGVSPVRVRQLIAAGQVQARQVAGVWLVDLASLPSAPRRGRPMSERVAWAVIQLGDGEPAPWLAPNEAHRARGRLAQLAADERPELLLRSWLAGRADRKVLSATDPDRVHDDPRIVASGLSDPRSHIFAGGQAEGYVHLDDFDAVRRDHLLIPDSHGNVVLHLASMAPSPPVPLLLLAADLADHDSPRELQRARELIAQAVEGVRG
ncbi:helix-turn-helix domain-containing protein [Pengzhenrongella sp.]|uniref:helix-turn-helix domain-containing protein n=1 Tax=Pengzhenrongella sp. TaxID=2888820 RepID=UPI002F9350C8